MLKQERTKWAQACDTCSSAACTVYCWADSAYLCTTCDAQVHAANSLASRHERVRVCQSCERAPASFFCKADAASLCTACDSEIHSANPLARRHQRVPIQPISGNSFTNHSCEIDLEVVGEDEEDEAEAASWLLPNSGKNNNGFSIGNDYLDLVDDQSNEYQLDCNVVPQRSYEGDGVVPLQTQEPKSHMLHTSGGSLSHMVHVSSIDLGLVPESTTSEATTLSSPKGVTEQLAYPQAQMLSPMDREARVMRYREKKKTRKFEKTIRYASRKAYAEKRPRIKGRFAKREEVDVEANEAFSTMIKFDNGYGIVPSF